jgi:hypothetical protein
MAGGNVMVLLLLLVFATAAHAKHFHSVFETMQDVSTPRTSPLPDARP